MRTSTDEVDGAVSAAPSKGEARAIPELLALQSVTRAYPIDGVRVGGRTRTMRTSRRRLRSTSLDTAIHKGDTSNRPETRCVMRAGISPTSYPPRRDCFG